MFLLFQLAGCCCCWCAGGSNPPVPVPSSESQYLGTWVCDNGDAWTFRPDGTYTFRTGVIAPQDGRITTYENAVWKLDEGSFLGVPLSGMREAGAQVSVAMNPPCAMLQGQACVRSAGVPSEALQGRWVSADGGVQVELRNDGFTRVAIDGTVHTGTLQPSAAGAGVQGTLLVCGAPIPLPFDVVEGPNGGLVLDGESMELVEPDYDRTRIEAESARRRRSRSSGGGGGDGDYDRDYDFD